MGNIEQRFYYRPDCLCPRRWQVQGREDQAPYGKGNFDG